MAKKNVVIEELHLLIGLPGSGKTTYANAYKSNNYPYNTQKVIVDFDKIQKQLNKISDPDERYQELVWRACSAYRVKTIFLDGLFLTQKDYEYILNLYYNNPVYDYNIKKIVIDYWVPDREACIYNDRGRRNASSEMSIKTLKIEKPDMTRLKTIFPIVPVIKYMEHIVVRRPEYLTFAQDYDIPLRKDKYLKSAAWCLGGTSYGWDGSRMPLSSEEPCEFTEFDGLLERVCPDITYLQYKKLRSACVECKDEPINDYYTEGREAFYLCDIERLYQMLKEMKKI